MLCLLFQEKKVSLCFPHLVRYDGRRSEGFVIRSPGQLEGFLPICAFQCYDLWAKTRGLEYLRANTQFSSDPSGNTSKVQQYSPRQQIEAARADGEPLLCSAFKHTCATVCGNWLLLKCISDSKLGPIDIQPGPVLRSALGSSLWLAKLSLSQDVQGVLIIDFKQMEA